MSPGVTVIGCDGRPLGPEAAEALAAAGHVVGTPRHLGAIPLPASAERIELKHLDDALDTITACGGRTVVLASGDPGFFGIVRALRARGITPQVIPAASSVTLAFARLGLDWDDALVVSAHGRDPQQALAAALAHPKAAILTAPGHARDLGGELLRASRQVYVAECLGTPAERITDLRAEPARDFADPNILIAVDPENTAGPRWLAGHQGAPGGWALPEDAFEHRDSMITKAEVRALVLARLGPAPGRTIWDVGAGSGSVAVECARFGARVIAVEADEAQCARIQQNARKHAVYLDIRHGRAPEALTGLPPADALFVGGGDRAVLAAAITQANSSRVVVTLAAVQRVGETNDLLTELGYQTEGVQLQASRLTSLPAGTSRLAAENPVFVIVGQNPCYSRDNDPRSFRRPGERP
ncbi:MAG: precorrin-6y C5,15-methyltransferase (decarboxylating) subunit CbiE [Actinobacteria bacterium]|nr:precorrin-6y C5,15-methyltransferase (decarboxylating) subunit CbiE [Actinomycetota bacterium]